MFQLHTKIIKFLYVSSLLTFIQEFFVLLQTSSDPLRKNPQSLSAPFSNVTEIANLNLHYQRSGGLWIYVAYKRSCIKGTLNGRYWVPFFTEMKCKKIYLCFFLLLILNLLRFNNKKLALVATRGLTPPPTLQTCPPHATNMFFVRPSLKKINS